MKFSVRTLVHVSVLIAIEIVLARFCSINTPFVRIGFGFVPIAVCAMMFGPVWAGIAAAVGDIIGAILFPTGAFFPGFTVSAAITGVVFGLFLYKGANTPERSQANTWARICGAVAINQIPISLFTNTLWLSILFGSPYLAVLPTRILQCCILIPLQIIVLRLLTKPITLYQKRQVA